MTVRAPAHVFDRGDEWRSLADFATDPGEVARIGVVYGRRRMGKSFLLRNLVNEVGGFYDQALEQEAKPALDRLANAWSQERGFPSAATVSFNDWEQALRTILDNPGDRPRLVVLDEFPYMAAVARELPSVLQLIADDTRTQPSSRSATRIILCGSALSVMAGLLEGSAALKGRATLELAIQPFDFRVAAAFWGVADNPAVAFELDAIIGGTPGYRDMLETIGLPEHPTDVGDWLAQGILNPGHAMFREDQYLLAEDRSLGDRALYQSIITAIAKGEATVTKIANSIGRPVTAMSRPLTALQRAGLVVARQDALKNRRPVYELTDPIVRFHHAITLPNIARFEARDIAATWQASDERFRTHVLGPHFAHVARVWTARFASEATTGGSVSEVQHALVPCREHGFDHELDVVAASSKKVRLIGEAKFTNKERTLGDLARLEHIRELVSNKNTNAIKLALFAGNGGFHKDLRDAADRRDDVELVDLDRLYGGD